MPPGAESVPDSKSMLFLQNFAIPIHYTLFAKSGSPEGFRIKSLKLPWLFLSAKNKKTNEKQITKTYFYLIIFFILLEINLTHAVSPVGRGVKEIDPKLFGDEARKNVQRKIKSLPNSISNNFL